MPSGALAPRRFERPNVFRSSPLFATAQAQMPFVKHAAHMLLLSRLSGERQVAKNADGSASQGPLSTTGMRAEVTWVCAYARDASLVSATATSACSPQAKQLRRPSTNTARSKPRWRHRNVLCIEFFSGI